VGDFAIQQVGATWLTSSPCGTFSMSNPHMVIDNRCRSSNLPRAKRNAFSAVARSA
jgi:hypothetical protein